MTKQTINIGTSENSNNGDPLRTAFQKINENFDELYDTETVGSDPSNFGSNLIPRTSDTYNLGSNNLRWDEGYINQIYARDWIDLGGKKITLDSDGNFVFPGILNATVRVTQDIQGDIFADDSTKVFDSATGIFTGDLTGSIFADDSTLLVDGVNGSIPYSVLSGAPSFGNWTFSSSTLSENSTGDAVIQSSDFAGSKLIIRTRGPNDKDWIFDQDGDLSLPGGGLLGQVWGDGVDNELTLKSPTAGGSAAYVALSSANEQNYVEVSNEGVVLAVRFSTEEFKKLTFGTDGNIKSLDSVPLQILSTGSSGAVSMAWSSSVDSPENIALVIANSPGATTSGAVDIVVGALAEPNIWTFDPDGALTIPGDIRSESAINIDINLSDSTLRRWTFGEDGNLTVPGTIISTPESPAPGIYPASATALDTDKQIQILTADETNDGYSLADGAEGQIMYFVPGSSLTSDVYIEIANARIMGEGPVEETDYSWTPFSGELLAPTTIAMAIFADGAWCLRGGVTD